MDAEKSDDNRKPSAEPTRPKTDLKAPFNKAVAFLKGLDLKLGVGLFVVYAIAALVVFAPVTANITQSAPGPAGNSYQNLWYMWWVGYSLLNLHTSFFYTNMLYVPIGANLIEQSMAPIASIMSLPFQAVSMPFAYNMMLLIGFALSGVAMFVLADYIVKDRRAAFVAGLIFAFSSFHIAMSYNHIGWINIEWIPLAIYFMIRMVRENGKYSNAIGLAISFVLVVFMGDVEQGIEIVMALVLILCAYLLSRRARTHIMSRRFWSYAALSIAVAFILGSWGFIPMLGAITQPGGLAEPAYLNNATYNNLLSDNIGSFLIPSYYNGIFDTNPGAYFTTSSALDVYGTDPAERTAYIGYIAIAFILYGLYRNYERSRLWIGLAVVFGLLSFGPSGILYSAYHSISVINVISEPGRFYLIFGVAVAMLAAFGFKDFLAVFHGSKNAKNVVLLSVVVFGLIFLIENNGVAISNSLYQQVATNGNVPVFYRDLAASNPADNFSILQLPILPDIYYSAQPDLYSAEAMYYMTASHKPMVGGNIAHVNTSQGLTLCNVPLIEAATYLQQVNDRQQPSLCTSGINGQPYTLQEDGLQFSPSPVIQNPANATTLLLSDYYPSVDFIVLNVNAYNQTSGPLLATYMESIFGSPVYSDSSTLVFSTYNATRNLYKSFVTYPTLNQWLAEKQVVNGSLQYFWTPVEPIPTNSGLLYGTLTVEAPYANQSAINSSLTSTAVEYVKTHIHLEAETNFGKTRLVIDALSPTGNLVNITREDVTANLTSYSFNTSLISGPQGNSLIFVQDSTNQSGYRQLIFIKNITIN